jgi:hypothetical protein
MTPDLPILERQVRALVTQDRLEEAETLLRPLVASGSGPLPVWRLLVQVLRLLGRSAEALPIQRMLVDTVPGDLAARFDLSEILLLRGEFDAGWRAYRYRYSLPHTARIERKVQRPRWEGEPIPGRTLLIHDEQGYGDTFQFLRLVPWAKQRSGARVVLEINPETLPLAQRSPLGIDTLIPNGALPPAFDVHCELMSLPMALRLQLSDLPGPLPYLAPDPARLAHWQQRLAGLQRPIVALAWAGRPNHHNDANRSMPLAALAPLAMPGVSFVAIQKGPAAAQATAPPAGMVLISLSDEIAGFDDTAAILSVADLLVSVDSSPVHLAGALDRPAWVMLPFMPDWRWLEGRSDTPWYPRHRLFRQPRRGDWGAVVAEVARALRALATRAPASDHGGIVGDPSCNTLPRRTSPSSGS